LTTKPFDFNRPADSRAPRAENARTSKTIGKKWRKLKKEITKIAGSPRRVSMILITAFRFIRKPDKSGGIPKKPAPDRK
jgi:hypothetical protein